MLAEGRDEVGRPRLLVGGFTAEGCSKEEMVERMRERERQKQGNYYLAACCLLLLSSSERDRRERDGFHSAYWNGAGTGTYSISLFLDERISSRASAGLEPWSGFTEYGCVGVCVCAKGLEANNLQALIPFSTVSTNVQPAWRSLVHGNIYRKRPLITPVV